MIRFFLWFRTTGAHATDSVHYGLRLDSRIGRRDVVFACNSLRNLVGLPGFEPGTSCTPSKRASQAAPQPDQKSV